MSFKSYGIQPYGAIPNERQLAHYQIEKKAFIHFGLYTFEDRYGYGNPPSIFAPKKLDPRQWVQSLKALGFQLIILTAKHHEGFCLWDTKTTDYSVMSSPCKRDIVREFTDACKEMDVRVGIYLSPWDNHSDLWGTDRYSDYYNAQLTELLTQYGRIDEVWWDGHGSSSGYCDWKRWAETIRHHQPHAAIFGTMGATDYADLRWVGNETGRAGETHYASIDPEDMYVENTAALYTGRQGAPRYIPSESDVSIRPAWCYLPEQNDQIKSGKQLNKIWFQSAGRNSQFLLNFPPNRDGLLYPKDLENAAAFHNCIQKMLAIDFAKEASISADSVHSPQCTPEHMLQSDETFYAAAQKEAVIDIKFPRPQRLNVLTLSEPIQLGERISSFQIEAITETDKALLFEGTSVGYYRACLLPEGDYSYLRLHLKGAATPLIRRLCLHLFEDLPEEPITNTKNIDLAALPSASTEYSADLRSAVVKFGGIYPYNFLRFVLEGAGDYELFHFNGFSYESIFQGSAAEGERVKLHLPEVQDGGYQLKLVATAPIRESDGIRVYYQ